MDTVDGCMVCRVVLFVGLDALYNGRLLLICFEMRSCVIREIQVKLKWEWSLRARISAIAESAVN